MKLTEIQQRAISTFEALPTPVKRAFMEYAEERIYQNNHRPATNEERSIMIKLESLIY